MTVRSFSIPRTAVVAVTAVVIFLPLGLIFWQSFLNAPFFNPEHRVGLAAYAFIFEDADFWTAFLNSILIAAGMVIIALPLGAALAFLLTRTDLPAQRSIEVLVLIPVFVSPMVLGDPEGHLVLSTYLYKLTNKLGTPSYHLMAAVAVCIVAVTFPLVLLQRWLLKSAGKYVSVKGKATRQKLLPLGGWKWVALGVVALWLIFTIVVPISGIALRAFVEQWGEGIKLTDVLTLENFTQVFSQSDQVRAIVN